MGQFFCCVLVTRKFGEEGIRVSGRAARFNQIELFVSHTQFQFLKNSDEPLKLAFRIRRNYNGL